tara:strand:+ start:209 stop:670 length:462 start_codon:yes stop_codon:yes gene_type:complete
MNRVKENYRRFLEHLEKSTDGVFHVARWLHSKGIPCTINPTFAPKEYNEEAKDNGDLWIQQKVEVKTMRFNFTDMESWPYKTFIVCASHSYDDTFIKPYKYVILSNDKTHAAIVDVKATKDKWYRMRKQDKRYIDYSQEFYFCPIELLEFVKL